MTPLVRVVPRGFPAGVAICAVGVVSGFLVALVDIDERMTIAAFALMLAGSFVWWGRNDLTRPQVLLPSIWFAAVAVSQLKVLHFETPWTPDVTFLIFVCPILFALSAWALGGGAIRPAVLPDNFVLNGTRLRIIATALVLSGALGLWLKSGLLGGIPLLSDSIDELRSAGGIKIPAYVTFLTNGFFLGSWFSLLNAVRSDCRHRVFDSMIIAVGILGVSASASRNTLLMMLAVPVIFLYQTGYFKKMSRRTVLGIVAIILVMFSITSGLFFFRTGQHSDSAFEKRFYSETVENTPTVLRPLLPVYLGVATPFETLNRLVGNGSAIGPGTGTFSMPGIPPQISPFGPKRDFYLVSSSLSRPYYFNVATYIGGFFADGGRVLALAASILLGGLFGSVWRSLLARASLLGCAATAYLAYVVGFLLYENLIGFYTLAVVWDLAVICAALAVSSVRVAPLSDPG